MEIFPQQLKGCVAVVVGATRGAGRGIATELGAAGATVYCTGRSTRSYRSELNRPETIEETAELVTQAGGLGIARQVDFSVETEVRAFFEALEHEQAGRLDLLVNDIGGDQRVRWKTPFWEVPIEDGFAVLDGGVRTHLLASRYAAPLLVRRKAGLIIEITDGDHTDYRGHLYYDLNKLAHQRVALGMAHELRPHGVSVVALTPGFLRSEAVLDSLGVTAETWRSAIAREPTLAGSESTRFIGRAVVALASDPHVRDRTGRTLATWDLAREYGFTDLNGTQPDWKAFYAAFRSA